MAAQFPEVAPAALTGAAATYYTVAANRKLLRAKIYLCNTSLAAVTCSVYAVPNGGSVAVANQIFAGSVDGLESKELDVCLNLATGGTIQALAATAAVIGVRIAPIEQVV